MFSYHGKKFFMEVGEAKNKSFSHHPDYLRNASAMLSLKYINTYMCT